METLVGIAGWDYPDWAGIVYPSPRLRGFHPIPYLSRFLDILEVNATFYSIPPPTAAEAWVRRAEHSRLQYAVKLFQGFTHDPDLLAGESAEQFKALVRPLAESGRLAGILAQFPQRFHASPESYRVVHAIADAFFSLPASLFFEFRHISWEDDRALKTIRDAGAEMVSIDYPFLASPESPALVCLNGSVYIRYHGRNRENWYRMAPQTASRDEQEATKVARYDYRYSLGELQTWVTQLQQHAESIQRAVLVFNNHARGQEVENAIMAQYLLRGAPVAVPHGPLTVNLFIAPYIAVPAPLPPVSVASHAGKKSPPPARPLFEP
jgi:uncharacterized protein YecE (DUF72 family)